MLHLNTFEQIQSLVQKIGTTTSPTTEHGWQLVVENYHLQAIQHMIYGGSAIIIGLFFLFIVTRAVSYSMRAAARGKECQPESPEAQEADRDLVISSIISVLAVAVLVFCSVYAYVTFENIWNWTGVMHPQLYAVHCLLEQINRPDRWTW